jgi:hypothetical protein
LIKARSVKARSVLPRFLMTRFPGVTVVVIVVKDLCFVAIVVIAA